MHRFTCSDFLSLLSADPIYLYISTRWLFGPIHIVPSAYVLFSRSSLYRRLGQRQMKASVGLDALEERVIIREMGSLEQVQRALSECFGSSDVAVRLNDYVPLMMPKNAASAGVDVDSYTLLHLASWNGHTDAVRALLEAGVDPNKPTLLQQQSALMLASRRGHYECVSLLLATNSVDVCQSAADGKTALMAAVGANQAGVLQLLLEQGASDRGAGGWMGLSAGAAAEAIGGENDVTRMIRAYESEFMGNILPVHGCKCVASWPGIYAKSWYVLQYALLIADRLRFTRVRYGRVCVPCVGTHWLQAPRQARSVLPWYSCRNTRPISGCTARTR
jgi:hypothetical protein